MQNRSQLSSTENHGAIVAVSLKSRSNCCSRLIHDRHAQLPNYTCLASRLANRSSTHPGRTRAPHPRSLSMTPDVSRRRPPSVHGCQRRCGQTPLSTPRRSNRLLHQRRSTSRTQASPTNNNTTSASSVNAWAQCTCNNLLIKPCVSSPAGKSPLVSSTIRS